MNSISILFTALGKRIVFPMRSQGYCANVHDNTLRELHEALCHPGVTRLSHFVRAKNLPYSVEDVRRVVSQCSVCSDLRPNFYNPQRAQLIKATQPFERLSLDFKGPLPSTSTNKYLLTIIDEYSRFPFCFACSNVNAQTVITCLNQVLVIFGTPAYIHSDRGAAFNVARVNCLFTKTWYCFQ